MRDDLLALTPERLALLANAGLVKRAQKELSAGSVPELEEDEQGTVLGSFADGARTRLPRELPLRKAPCSCGAAGVCRHRVALVLAYQLRHGAAAPRIASEPWDPGGLSDELIAGVCGDGSIARAQAALSGSVVVALQPGALPVAQLPSATVQFLAPRDLAAARCDCAIGHGCEHVVLAVWAFRRQPSGGMVELGSAEGAMHPEVTASIDAALARFATRGLTDAGAARELASARALAEKAGWLWVADALEELERQRDAYERQSALFSTRACADGAAEVHARLAAADSARALPARYILGSDARAETALDQVRLISLGARLQADDQERMGRIYFAEPRTGAVLVLEKRWAFPEGTPAKNGAELGELFASSRMSLTALARSELLTRAAKRKANGLIDLSTARGMKSSVLAASGGWSELPAPIAVSALGAHTAALRGRPPAFLRPRNLGEDVHVVGIGGVEDVSWNPGEQELVALVRDASGESLTLRMPHRTVAPGAVDATAKALAMNPRFVSGRLTRSREGWELTPLAIVADRFVVPDLERPAPRPLPRLERSAPPPPELQTLLDQLSTTVEAGIHKGVSGARPAAGPLATRLEEAGMGRIAQRLRSVSAGSAPALLDVALLSLLIRTTPDPG